MLIHAYPHEHFFKQIYFDCLTNLHAYLNYANIAWAGTHKTKLKKKPKANKICFTYNILPVLNFMIKPLFLSLNVLNVYQINIFHSVQFMHKIKNQNIPHILLKLPLSTMPSLSNKFILNKLLGTQKIPKNFVVFNVS